jgi:quinol monooxygenase YgiN
MISFTARFRVSVERRPQVVASLCGTLGPTRAMPGCVRCQLCLDVRDENALMYVEEWEDLRSLKAHVRSDRYRVVLSALDHACDAPELRFDTISECRGMEFIASCRKGLVEEN